MTLVSSEREIQKEEHKMPSTGLWESFAEARSYWSKVKCKETKANLGNLPFCLFILSCDEVPAVLK